MNVFVQQHLLNILKPLAENVRSLKEQVDSLRDDFLGRSVVIGNHSAQFRDHSEQMLQMKRAMDEVAAGASAHREDLSKLLDIMAKASTDRFDSLQSKMEQDISELRAETGSLLQFRKASEAEAQRLAALVDKLGAKSTGHDEYLAKLQESCDLNNHCFLGLSERLESVKSVANNSRDELQRLKTTVSVNHQQQRDSATKMQRQLDAAEAKVQQSYEDTRSTSAKVKEMSAGFESLSTTLADMEGNLHAEQLGSAEKTAMEAEKNAEVQKVAMEGKSALERLADRLSSMKEETTALTQQLHDKVSGEVQGLATRIDGCEARAESHALALKSMETSLASTREVLLEELMPSVKVQGKKVEALIERADVTDAESRSLFIAQDEMRKSMEIDAEDLAEVKTRVGEVEEDIQAERAALQELNNKLAASEGRVSDIARHADLAHEFVQGFGKGLQDTYQEVVEGRSGMLMYKDTSKPRNLPALPRSPILRRSHSSQNDSKVSAIEGLPVRPASSAD